MAMHFGAHSAEERAFDCIERDVSIRVDYSHKHETFVQNDTNTKFITAKHAKTRKI